MKRTFGIVSVLSLALVMTVAAIAQPAPATKPEHLSNGQLNALIASAKTPAEHHRIALYYQAKATDYLAQAAEHQKMVDAYKANPSLSAKNAAGTINHCEYFVQEFKTLAAKSQEMATMHEKMATDAEKM
ncbi:MAG TPA: hypothetical protein VGB94_14370 [Acidobacteriaceae bacterium]